MVIAVLNMKRQAKVTAKINNKIRRKARHVMVNFRKKKYAIKSKQRTPV